MNNEKETTMKRPTTTAEDVSFAKMYMEFANIDARIIVDWVEKNFRPDEVYPDIKEFVKENYSPEEIFDDDQLEKWAENADYVRPHDDYPEREL
jgi:hypothetical protein